jgi:hypothetical protein
MNAVVIEAVDLLKATRTEQLADARHAAAIELAISLGRLPKGTEIILKSGDNSHATEILVRRPPQPDYSLLARVHGEEVVCVDDPPTTVAESGA